MNETLKAIPMTELMRLGAEIQYARERSLSRTEMGAACFYGECLRLIDAERRRRNAEAGLPDDPNDSWFSEQVEG